MSDFNTRMREAREAKGLSYERAAAHASRLLLPPQEFTGVTLQRTERGAEAAADPIRLWAIAQVYEVDLEELSPIAAGWFSGSLGGGTRRRRNKTCETAWAGTSAAIAA